MVENSLFPNGRPTIKEDVDRAFDQYRLAVENWDNVRARRQTSNVFFVSINSAILGLAAIEKVSLSLLAGVGLAICALWFFSILNYRSLTDDKYRVIIELENLFPTSPFLAESSIVKEGFARMVRRRFTWVERGITMVFAAFYVGLLLFPSIPSSGVKLKVEFDALSVAQ